jgi:hypothetical protein
MLGWTERPKGTPGCIHKQLVSSKSISVLPSRSPRAKPRETTGAVEQLSREAKRALKEENRQLKAENLVYQKYFALFEERFMEQRKEAERLKREVTKKQMRDVQSIGKGSELTRCLSEKTLLPPPTPTPPFKHHHPHQRSFRSQDNL